MITPELYRHDLEIVRNTAAQVIKDFGLAGIEIAFLVAIPKPLIRNYFSK
ncbi:MAG: hypothetical protein IPK08_17750 [Bacteroidetes bacterium]|nr:hypothetical protein [Bacteroidota bacterium]